jgi:hypothetical protein
MTACAIDMLYLTAEGMLQTLAIFNSYFPKLFCNIFWQNEYVMIIKLTSPCFMQTTVLIGVLNPVCRFLLKSAGKILIVKILCSAQDHKSLQMFKCNENKLCPVFESKVLSLTCMYKR